MKRILLATTALAAVSMASSAFAMGADAKFNGAYDFGWFSLSDDHKGPGDDDRTYGAGNLKVTAESTGDNGLTYGMGAELLLQDNTHERSDTMRNSNNAFIYIKGDFGEVSFGHQGNARGSFGIGAPTHAGGYGGPDIRDAGSFLDNSTNPDQSTHFRTSTDLIHAPNDIGGNDDAKVKYISPSFSGFQFGADVQDSDKTDKGNEMSIGASFTTDVAGGTIKIAGNNHSNDLENDGNRGTAKVTGNHLGVSFSQGAFTVTAGTYDGEEGTLDKESTAFGLGFKVSDGFEVGASYTTAESTGNVASDTRKQEGSFQSVTGSYTIAPGLKTQLGLSQFEVEDKETAARNNEGSSVTWELKFSF